MLTNKEHLVQKTVKFTEAFLKNVKHIRCYCSIYIYLMDIYRSVRICKNVPTRIRPEAGHRPASGLCGSPNLRGLAVKDQSVS